MVSQIWISGDKSFCHSSSCHFLMLGSAEGSGDVNMEKEIPTRSGPRMKSPELALTKLSFMICGLKSRVRRSVSNLLSNAFENRHRL